jgi:hypothetical protein
MEKKCKVAILPTDKAENAILIFNGRNKFAEYHKQFFTQQYLRSMGTDGCNSFHLYILSDDEIKEGDWMIVTNTTNNVITGYNSPIIAKYDYASSNSCLKIIATTDSSLTDGCLNNIPLSDHTCVNKKPLPFIPQSFIDKYVSEYNKGNMIEEVIVEYEEFMTDIVIGKSEQVLKLNPDDTINIISIKDSWTREEVIELMSKSFDRGVSRKSFDQIWIENNLY